MFSYVFTMSKIFFWPMAPLNTPLVTHDIIALPSMVIETGSDIKNVLEASTDIGGGGWLTHERRCIASEACVSHPAISVDASNTFLLYHFRL